MVCRTLCDGNEGLHAIQNKAQQPLSGAVVKLVLDGIKAEWHLLETLPSRKQLLCMCAGYMSVTNAFTSRTNNVIDVHNHMRKKVLRPEKHWVTNDDYFQIFKSVLSVCVVDC